MYSRSKPFEAAYSNFLEDVFAQGISSVSTAETSTRRMLTLAGFYRVVRSKRTGLLHSELLDRGTGKWMKTRRTFISGFWAKDNELLGSIQSAWAARLWSYMPAAEVCYPKLTKKHIAARHTPATLVNAYVGLAVDRRLSTAPVRTAAKRCLVAALWNYLVDREILDLSIAVFGRKAGLAEYNYTVRHRAVLAARARETPNLLPLIGNYLKMTDCRLTGAESPPANIVALARQSLFTPGTSDFAACNGWDGVSLGPEALTPQSWRYLVTQSRTALEHMWRLADDSSYNNGMLPGVSMARALNMLAKTQEAPPLSFVIWWMGVLRRLESMTPASADIAQGCTSLARFLRLASAQATTAAKRGRLKRFIRGDLVLAWDWFRDDEPRQASHLGNLRFFDKNMTWSAVMRAQREWHATAAARAEARRQANRQAYERYMTELRARSWTSCVEACTVESVEVRPLTTGVALQEEGREMTHCVGGANYIEACVKGESRIFSLRTPGDRATVELYLTGGSDWKVAQVFREENEPTSKQIQRAAAVLAKNYSQAYRAAKRPPVRALDGG